MTGKREEKTSEVQRSCGHGAQHAAPLRRCGRGFQIDDLGLQRFFVEAQTSQGDGQIKTPRAGASGVQVQDAILHGLLWLMSMAGNYGAESGGFGLEINVTQIVEHVKTFVTTVHDESGWQFGGPWSGIDVATDGE